MQLQSKFIETICGVVPDCLAIYRFGTWGTKDYRSDSDIDLAVLASSPLDSVVCWDLAQLLAAIAGRDVDLVDLSRAVTVLRMQIVATGERCLLRIETEYFGHEDEFDVVENRLGDFREFTSEVLRRGV